MNLCENNVKRTIEILIVDFCFYLQETQKKIIFLVENKIIR